MTLQLRFWGTRGSVPAPGPRTVRYGGNTPCVEVRTGTGTLVILDAGTGIRELGQSLIARRNGSGDAIAADIFVTHAHWDHIQGIPFFAPLFERGNRFRVFGSRTLETDIGTVVRRQMAPAVFPVTFDEIGAQVEFCGIGEGARTGDGYEVSAFSVRHPGGALGYRFYDCADGGRSGASFAYVSDNELGGDEAYPPAPDWRDRLVAWMRGARLLVHDATYTTDEYTRYRGWGHSTFEDAVTLALDAGVSELVLYHHKPERSDEELDRCVEASRALVEARGATMAVRAAAEGMSISI